MTDDQRKRSAFRPLLGFLILVILGVLAWLIAPAAIRVLADVLPFFRGNELPLSTTRPLFTAVIIVLALIVLGLVAALTAPKDEQGSSAAQLEQQREALRRRQRDARAQARKSKGRH